MKRFKEILEENLKTTANITQKWNKNDELDYKAWENDVKSALTNIKTKNKIDDNTTILFRTDKDKEKKIKFSEIFDHVKIGERFSIGCKIWEDNTGKKDIPIIWIQYK